MKRLCVILLIKVPLGQLERQLIGNALGTHYIRRLLRELNNSTWACIQLL